MIGLKTEETRKMAQQIGNLMPTIRPATTATVSPKPLTKSLTLAELEALPATLTEAQWAMVEATAIAPLPELSPCDPQTFAKLLRTMRAALPMRSLDDDGGKLIAATYARMLGGYCREALAYMVERAIAELKWFPTVAECRDMLADWRRDDEAVAAKYRAQGLIGGRDASAIQGFYERHEADLERLRDRQVTQEELDGLPDFTRTVAEAKGYVSLVDGRFMVRKIAA